MLKKILIIVILVIVALAAIYYIYYPFNEEGCEKLRQKIENLITENRTCNLASDCSVGLDAGCDFSCGVYLNTKISKGIIQRYRERCSTCNEECNFDYKKPVCDTHVCRASGGAVYIDTDKGEYVAGEEITLNVTSNLLKEVGFSFPIELCLRPTIMRLENYNEETKEWLSSGVGLLFENKKVVFYKDPGYCPSYEIKNCTKEEAHKFIDVETLKIDQSAAFTIPTEVIAPCDERGAEELEPITGRYRISIYYELPEQSGEEIYSNEFIVK